MDTGTKSGSRNRLIAFRVSEALYTSLVQLAEKEHRNLSQMARLLVENGLAEQERLRALAERDQEWMAYWHTALPETDQDVAAGRVARYDDIDSFFDALDAVAAEQPGT